MNPTQDQQKLAEWLHERTLEISLREDAAEESPFAAEILGGEPPPADGQIRLWPARAMTDEPVYGLLLAAGYGTWTFLPFSPYATPATPDEWQLREQMPLRVVQAWNRRHIPRAVAQASWCAETLSELERLAVRQFLTRLDAGEAGDGRCGPPLRHPLDPRWEYRGEEEARVTRTLGEVWPQSVEGTDILLAAEPPPQEPGD